MQKGCIQLYYGDGKGKTTAAMGQIVRCVGHGFKVLVSRSQTAVRYR